MKRQIFIGFAALVSCIFITAAGRGDEANAPERPPEGIAATDTSLQRGTGDWNDDQRLIGLRGEGHWFVGTDITFLSFDAATGGQITMSFNNTNTPGTEVSLLGGNGIENGTGFAPRMWLGRQFNEKWGVAARFWQLDTYVDKLPAATPGTVIGQNFLTMSEIGRTKLYTVDLEGIRSFEIGNTKFDATFGGRYASFRADSAMSAFGVFQSGSYAQISLSNFTSFEGPGVTYSLTGRRRLGDSPWHVFMSGRGSNLFGESDGYARVAGTLAVPPNAPLVGAATVTRNNYDTSASIFELQVGLECNYPLANLPMNVFIRGAFEYQYWTIMNPSVGGAGFGGTLANFQVNSFSSHTSQASAQLLGFVLSTGVTW
jgi:hypothetical protein